MLRDMVELGLEEDILLLEKTHTLHSAPLAGEVRAMDKGSAWTSLDIRHADKRVPAHGCDLLTTPGLPRQALLPFCS